MPLSPEPNPRLVFERLFAPALRASARKNLELRREQQKSILDFVRDDARALERQLGGHDQQKLDEYLTSVREIEQQLERRAIQGCRRTRRWMPRPASRPAFREHIRADV